MQVKRDSRKQKEMVHSQKCTVPLPVSDEDHRNTHGSLMPCSWMRERESRRSRWVETWAYHYLTAAQWMDGYLGTTDDLENCPVEVRVNGISEGRE